MPRVVQIDVERLRALASDPRVGGHEIARQFGIGRATFYFTLSESDELWAIYETARRAAGFTVARRTPRQPRSLLSADEIHILEAIAGLPPDARTASKIREVAIGLGITPGRFGTVLYNLENEKHEIWSQTDGKPPVTRFYLREEEAAATGAQDARDPQAGMPALRREAA
jgi:hypothetical protein